MLELKQNTPWKLGNTPVKISGYNSDRSHSIVSCSGRLWRISPIQSRDSARYVLNSIWITDRKNVSCDDATDIHKYVHVANSY